MSQHLFRLSRRAASSNFVSSAPRISSTPARPFHTTSPNMVVQAVSKKSEWDTLLAEGKPVLVDFFATWCGPCKIISPIFEQHSDDPTYKDTVNFAKIDVDAVPDVAAELGIRAMPTFMLFKDGDKVDELLGANPQGLKTLVEKALSP